MKVLIMALIFTLVGCGGKKNSASLPGIDKPDKDGLVIIGRSSINVKVGETYYASLMNTFQNALLPLAYANSGTLPVSVVLAPNTNMKMSSEDFVIPVLSNEVLSFGFLKLTELNTNSLRKCPQNPGRKCTRALIRVYTSDVAGRGFYNTEDSYGVPLLASGTAAEQEVGLGSGEAYSVHEISIPSNKHTVLLNDFPSPVINIKGDFANAGAGSYSTTINVEFALAP